jgi:hypothetical protein
MADALLFVKKGVRNFSIREETRFFRTVFSGGPENKRGFCRICKTLFVRHDCVDVIFSSWRLSSLLFSSRLSLQLSLRLSLQLSLRLSLPFVSHLLSESSEELLRCFAKEHFFADYYTKIIDKKFILPSFFFSFGFSPIALTTLPNLQGQRLLLLIEKISFSRALS